MTILRSIGIAALFTVLGIGAFGQTQVIGTLPALKDITVAADIESTAPETVSVNAFMPYTIAPDAVIAAATGATGIFNASGFKWTVPGATFFKADGTSALDLSPVGAAGYFKQNTVYVKMPSSATALTLSVAERSNPKFDALAGCEDVTPEVLSINVVALPIMPTVTSDIGGCSASVNYTLGYDFSGASNFPLYIKYSVASYDASGAATTGTPQTYYYRIADASGKMIIPASQLIASLPAGATLVADGKYTVTLSSIWDQASVKALNRTSNIAGVTTEVTGSVASNIVKLPTPVTTPIQHIKNLE